jgi:hypothetical protein
MPGAPRVILIGGASHVLTLSPEALIESVLAH